jgi:penicillin-binding protein 2
MGGAGLIERPDPRLATRARTIAVIVIAALAILLGRLFQMQVLVSAEYRAQADENRIRPERIAALRGRICGRNGGVLADNRPAFNIAVVPYEVRQDLGVLDHLANLVGADREALRAAAEEGLSRPHQSRVILRDVDLTIVSIVEEHGFELPGVLVESEPVRVYPEGPVAAHVLGYVGEMSEREIEERKSSGAALGTRVGRAGLERWYDEILRGQDGVRYVQEDAHGRRLGALREAEPVAGEDLFLTLDEGLQARAESLLALQIAGTVVAIDPETGGILALACSPSFDPNLFSVAVPGAIWDSLSNDPLHPLLDRAIQATFPPGSTFKPVTAAAGLDQRAVTPESHLLPCFGAWQFGSRAFHCWRPEGHGSLPLREAIEQSCDVYFYQVGARLDLDRFAALAGALGLGQKSAVDLPGEKGGLIPTTKYMNDRYGKNGWGAGALLNHAIGQGEVLATPLQMARLYAALGSGRLTEPHLLVQSVDAEGKVTVRDVSSPKPLSLPDEILRPIREGVTRAVQGDRGTGKSARVPGILVAGKTGTAQNPHGEDHSWFAAWAPASYPEIALAVIVENAGHGSEVAAPIAGDLLRYWFGRERT